MQKAFVIYKLSGAGNTFAFVDATKNSKYTAWEDQPMTPPKSAQLAKRKKLVQHVCSTTEGLSCDGFVFMDKENGKWLWDFYNKDGSHAEMCGNAARCAVLFATDILGEKRNQISLVTKAGTIFGEKLGPHLFEITMTNDFHILKELSKIDSGRTLQMKLIDTGVPHLVFEGEPLSKEASSKLRMDQTISRAGSNVTSYVVIGDNHIQAVTFERGVEDFTLACGTGAVAAALDYWHKTSFAKNHTWIKVDMPGGRLQVCCSQNEKPRMRGPAVVLLKAKINKEYL